MSELTKGEKERIVIDVLHDFNNIEVGTNLQKMAEKILDAIEPPEVKPGMWGKFWDNDGETSEYGELMHIEHGETTGRVFLAGSDNYYDNFRSIPGLKEAIEKLE